MPKGYVDIDPERCKGCGLCINACPNKVLGISEQFNSKGLHPAFAVNPEKCTGCAICGRTCPECAIEVYREEARNAG